MSLDFKQLLGTGKNNRIACLFLKKDIFEGMPTALQHPELNLKIGYWSVEQKHEKYFKSSWKGLGLKSPTRNREQRSREPSHLQSRQISPGPSCPCLPDLLAPPGGIPNNVVYREAARAISSSAGTDKSKLAANSIPALRAWLSGAINQKKPCPSLLWIQNSHVALISKFLAVS